jgi:hypothetical protein
MTIMRRAAPSIGIVWALAVASLAAAQDAPRPRVTVVIKPAAPSTTTASDKAVPTLPDQPALRKAIRPAIGAGRAAPFSSSVSLALAAPIVMGGVAPLKGLNALSPSAQASQCRAQCAKARYICTAQDAGDCDTVWGQCVVRCSGANSR